MTLLSNLELIRRVPLFSSLTEEQASVIAEAVFKHRYKKNEVVVKQGEMSNSLHIFLTGRAHVVMEDGRGREVIISTLRQGDYVGEMSLIDEEPHSATVRTDMDSDVLTLGREPFLSCLPDPSSFTQNMMRKLVKRIRYANVQIESLALMDVQGRVARLLIEFASDDGAGNLVIRDRISRHDLAKMVGASREMVSRVLKVFEEQGFVQNLPDGSSLIKEHVQTTW